MYSCNTNLTRRQSGKNMTRFAIANVIIHDTIGNETSYEKMHNSIQNGLIIAERKPFFLEINSYRLYDHCGHELDTNKGDREEEEFQVYSRKDPIKLIMSDYPELEEYHDKKKNEYADFINSSGEYSMPDNHAITINSLTHKFLEESKNNIVMCEGVNDGFYGTLKKYQ